MEKNSLMGGVEFPHEQLLMSLLQAKGSNATLKGKNKKLRKELRDVEKKLSEALGCRSAAAIQALRGNVNLYEGRVVSLNKRIEIISKDNERLKRVAVEQHWEIKKLRESIVEGSNGREKQKTASDGFVD